MYICGNGRDGLQHDRFPNRMQQPAQVGAFHIVSAHARNFFRVGHAGQRVTPELPDVCFIAWNLDRSTLQRNRDSDLRQLIYAKHGDGMLERSIRSPNHIGG